MATDEVRSVITSRAWFPDLIQIYRHSLVLSQKASRPVQHRLLIKGQGRDKALSPASPIFRTKQRLLSTPTKSSKMSVTMKTFTWRMATRIEISKQVLIRLREESPPLKAEIKRTSLYSDELILRDQTLKNTKMAAALVKSSTSRVRISLWSSPASLPVVLATFFIWPSAA